MRGRDTRRGQELDDWFAEPESSPRQRGRPSALRKQDELQTPEHPQGPAQIDDWLSGGDAGSKRRSRFGARRMLSGPERAAAAAAGLAVCLLIGLAAGGVFSGASSHPTTINTLQRKTAPTTPPHATPRRLRAPATTLKPGDHGAQVKVLQHVLASLGYSPGSVDGQYGTATQQAVAHFQHTSGLIADGIVGPQTLRALTRTLNSP
jgi:Putative peptidoglycan binding domain